MYSFLTYIAFDLIDIFYYTFIYILMRLLFHKKDIFSFLYFFIIDVIFLSELLSIMMQLNGRIISFKYNFVDIAGIGILVLRNSAIYLNSI